MIIYMTKVMGEDNGFAAIQVGQGSTATAGVLLYRWGATYRAGAGGGSDAGAGVGQGAGVAMPCQQCYSWCTLYCWGVQTARSPPACLTPCLLAAQPV